MTLQIVSRSFFVREKWRLHCSNKKFSKSQTKRSLYRDEAHKNSMVERNVTVLMTLLIL